MKLLRCSILLFLLLLALSACSKEEAPGDIDEPPAVTNENPPENEEPEAGKATISVSVPAGLTEFFQSLTAPDLTVTVLEESSNASSDSGLYEADLFALSPREAADLYSSDQSIRLLAVVDPGDPDVRNSMICLAAKDAYVVERSELIDQFLALYKEAADEDEVAYCATGWDMLDLVQVELEAQYQEDPRPELSIPDSGLFYLP